MIPRFWDTLQVCQSPNSIAIMQACKLSGEAGFSMDYMAL